MTTSAQKFLDIAEIKDDVVILKNGHLRGILMVSSINFALKSSDEQDALIYAYQNFINSLDFSVQIFINSRQFNIDPYLESLEKMEKDQPNELLRIQTHEYRSYIKNLVEIANIMSKTFYVVIPFSALLSSETNFIDKIFFLSNKTNTISMKKEDFARDKAQLMQRISHIQGGLSSLGLRSEMLQTQELIELFYNIYNPDISEKKGLANIEELEMGENTM